MYRLVLGLTSLAACQGFAQPASPACGCAEPARIEITVRAVSLNGQPWDETGGLGALIGRENAHLPDLAVMLQPIAPSNSCPSLANPISLPDTVRLQRQTVEDGRLIRACPTIEWVPLLEVPPPPSQLPAGRLPQLRVRNTLLCLDTTQMTFEDVPLPHLPYRVSILDADFGNTAELVFQHAGWGGGLLPFALHADARYLGQAAYCAAPSQGAEICELRTRQGVVIGNVRITRPSTSVMIYRDNPENAARALIYKVTTGVAPIAWASTTRIRNAFENEQTLTAFFQEYEDGFQKDLEKAVANCDPVGIFRVVANYLAPLRPTYFGLEEESAIRRVVNAAIDQLREDAVPTLSTEIAVDSADQVFRRVLTLHEKGAINDQLWNRLLEVFPDNELPFPRLGSRADLTNWVNSESYRRAVETVQNGGYARLFKAFKIIDAGLSVMKFSEDIAERLRWQRNNPNYIKLRERFVLVAKAYSSAAVVKLGFARSPAWGKLVDNIDEMMRYMQEPG